MRFLLEDALNGCIGVKSGGDRTSRRFNCCNGICRGSGDDDVNWLFERVFFSATEQLDTIPELVDAIGMEEFADCDRVFRIDSTLVNPILNSVKIHGDQIGREAVEDIVSPGIQLSLRRLRKREDVSKRVSWTQRTNS